MNLKPYVNLTTRLWTWILRIWEFFMHNQLHSLAQEEICYLDIPFQAHGSSIHLIWAKWISLGFPILTILSKNMNFIWSAQQQSTWHYLFQVYFTFSWLEINYEIYILCSLQRILFNFFFTFSHGCEPKFQMDILGTSSNGTSTY
jgi:hypothetical protein